MSRTLLVVDDEPNMRQMILASLADGGYTVLAAATGEEALRLAAARPVDLLVTDMKMPKMDGLDLLLEMRRRFPALPAIVMTGYAVEDRVKKALSLGHVSFLAKPFDIDDFERLVREIISQPPPAAV